MTVKQPESRVSAVVINHPRGTSALLLFGVVVHAVISHKWSGVPTFSENLNGVKDVATLYLGAAAAVATVGGFAGIVVVFAMTQGLKRFARLRAVGGESLEVNWIHPISVSFLSAAILIAAAYSQIIGRVGQGSWLFEIAAVLAVHGVLRLIWLLGRLIRAVRLGDIDSRTPMATDGEAIPRLADTDLS